MGDEQAEQRVDLPEHSGTRVVQGVDLDLLDATLDEIRPTLQADGGDMRFHGIDEQGIVSVELTGACGTCPLSAMTLVFGIEQVVLQKVPGVLGVVVCSPAIPAAFSDLSR